MDNQEIERLIHELSSDFYNGKITAAYYSEKKLALMKELKANALPIDKEISTNTPYNDDDVAFYSADSTVLNKSNTGIDIIKYKRFYTILPLALSAVILIVGLFLYQTFDANFNSKDLRVQTNPVGSCVSNEIPWNQVSCPESTSTEYVGGTASRITAVVDSHEECKPSSSVEAFDGMIYCWEIIY
jgi:hypothetical protein